MNEFSTARIKSALRRLEELNAPEKYKKIMEMRDKVNLCESPAFKTLYNGFYRVLFRDKEWYGFYYRLMQEKKGQAVSFEDIFTAILKKTGRFEASFSAKLLHTLRPEFPAWDMWIGKNTGIKIPAYNLIKRKDKIIERYGLLVTWFNDYKKSENGKTMLRLFDGCFPKSGITSTKKIDLVLWQIR